jgi:DNA polymerase elongation subunit (family B)
MYQDQRDTKNVRDDKKILKKVWQLLDEADILITQNGVKFDVKKLNARFAYHGMQKPSSYQHIDTLKVAKKYFAFTSNKLSFLADFLKTKHRKLTHGNFPGFSLWSECLKGNQKAWQEMKRYNINDVLVLQEVWEKLRAWDSTINFSTYDDAPGKLCQCGNESFIANGYKYTAKGKYQRWKCKSCGSEKSTGSNLFKTEKKKSL